VLAALKKLKFVFAPFLKLHVLHAATKLLSS